VRLLDAIWLALAQIRAQKLKSFFSVIGVVIGVMFLITVVTILEGMNRYMEDDFARAIFGLNTISVSRQPSVRLDVGLTQEEQQREWQRRPLLRLDDVRAIHQQLTVPAIVGASSATVGGVRALHGEEVDGVTLVAASPEYFNILELDVARGRLFGPLENEVGLPVVVLGSETADKLFGPLDPLGRTVRIQDVEFEVVGVLEPRGQLFFISLDNRAVAPMGSPMGPLTNGRGIVSRIYVKSESAQLLNAALIEVEAIMRARHRLRPDQPNSFELETQHESIAFWATISQMLFLAFPALVGIALVVGGMVIMNIMLMSVVERTREIGMRKAVGARRRDIVVQILVESSALSFTGAALGIVLGVGLAKLIQSVSPLPATVGLHWLAIAAVMGLTVGVAAGVYPAARAARLDPVVALRAE
jgi:putative ABC transport system permease protein